MFLVVTKNRNSNNYSNSDLCLRFYFFVFSSILCFIRQKTVFFFIHIFFICDNSPCHVEKAKEQLPTYHQRPNALSSLDIYTMVYYQCFQALCAISLVRSHRMLMLSMVLDKDDDNSLLLLYRHHQSILHNNNFLFVLDSMFMNIEPEDIIPHLLPANRNITSALEY